MKADYWKGTKVISQSNRVVFYADVFIMVKNGSALLCSRSRLKGLYAEMYSISLAAISTRDYAFGLFVTFHEET